MQNLDIDDQAEEDEDEDEDDGVPSQSRSHSNQQNTKQNSGVVLHERVIPQEKEKFERDPNEKEENWPLHKAVWKGDLDKVLEILNFSNPNNPLNPDIIDSRDRRGNPPLHLAIHLRHRDIVQALLQAGADPLVKNGGGWNALQEAIASSDRLISTEIYISIQKAIQQKYYSQVPELLSALENLPDFYMELVWEFKSWLPLVSRFCPSDTYKIWKKGSSFRADTTLVGFQNYSWVRGNLSIRFLGRNSEQPGHMISLNEQKKTIEYYNNFEYKSENQIKTDIHMLFCRTLLKGTNRWI